MNKKITELVNSIKELYIPILGADKELHIFKSAALNGFGNYCLIIKRHEIEFIEKLNLKCVTILEYETGKIEKNNQRVENGFELMNTILNRVNQDIKAQKVTFLTRK